MSPELTKKLFDEFPYLYQDIPKDPRQNYMGWGFQCDDGWFDILYDLSKDLQDIIDRWDEGTPPYCAGAKEKFGRLDYFMSLHNDEIAAATEAARSRSLLTCEVCGKVGKLEKFGYWLKTLCPEHKKEREQGR